MEPSYAGHNYPSYMSDMYHPHNAQGAMPTPMVPSRSGAPAWPHMPLQQHEFMMTANAMEDKKPWGHIPSVGDAAHVAPGKDADKQAPKRSRMSIRDEQPSETSSHGENGGGGQSSTAGSTSNPMLPVWELAAVLGPGAASLHSGRRSTSLGADRGRGEVDTLAGSKESSESQDDSDDDGEDGDDKVKDKSKQQMNRKAAQLSRRRKKERISELEQNVINLSRRNHELKVINDTLRTLLNDRSKQQSDNEHRIMHLLRTKNHQLKQALHELQAHSSRGNAELPHAVIMNAASLLGPDFQFQQLGVLPPLAPPPSPAGSNAYMGVMPQQYGAGGMFPGVDGLSDAHHTTFSHPLQPQNRNMGMNMSAMMMPRQMPTGMEMGMGSFLRPPHGNQSGMRHDLDSYATMGMNRMPSDQQELPGIVQSTKL